MRFTHGSNMDYLYIEVNEKIDAVMGNMPRDLRRPRVIKASASDIPVFYLNLYMDMASRWPRIFQGSWSLASLPTG
jgi:multidrug efflux pump subunit AcrB